MEVVVFYLGSCALILTWWHLVGQESLRKVPLRLSILGDLAKTAVEAAEHDSKKLGFDSLTKYQTAERGLKALAEGSGYRVNDQEAYTLIHSVLRQNELYDEALESAKF